MNFESSALTTPSGVTISGLISHSMASKRTNASKSWPTIFAICFCSDVSVTPAPYTSRRACHGWKPSSGSMWSRTSASGLTAATSSISTPPCVVNMNSGFLAPRSNVSER